MIIDFHTHCFPEKIAERAMKTLSFNSGVLPNTDGTLNGLIKCMDEDNINISVVMNIATNEKQQTAVNDFGASIQNDRIISFGSVHPDSENVLEELERIKELGLKGVKFHPEYQNFYVDDEKMKPIYKKISELGLITLFHAGEDIGYKRPYHCMPENLEKALSWFSSPVVAAHLGGLGSSEDVLKHLCGKDLYLDMAFSYGTVSKPYVSDIIEKHGTDKILFGSDCPWHRPAWEKVLVEYLDLTPKEKEQIYYKNAKELLNI